MEKQKMAVAVMVLALLVGLGFQIVRDNERRRELDMYETKLEVAPPITDEEYVLQGPFDGFSWYDTMKLRQIEEQLEDRDPLVDRVFNLIGLEVDGRFWWSCDDQWIEIEAPCEIP